MTRAVTESLRERLTRLEAAGEGGASLTLDGRVVATQGDVVEVALEGDVTPRAGAAVARFTAGRASPVALLLRHGGAP